MSADHVLHDDQVLLERLAAALRVEPPPPVEPSADELAFLAVVVTDRQISRQVAHDTSRPHSPRNPVVVGLARRRVQRYGSRLIAVVGAATILGGATAAAAATGKIDALRPVRQAEYDLGVPGVESPRLSDIRQTLDTLARARKNHDAVAESAASAKLAVQYHRLDSAEQHDIVPIVLEQEAVDPALAGDLPTTATKDPPTTVAPPSPDTAPPQSAPSDTSPPHTSPSDTAPPQSAPSDTAPPQSAPSDTAPPQTSPSDTAPPQTAPSDTSPPQTSPSDTSP